MFIVTRLPQSPVAQGSVSLCPGTDHLNYKNVSNEIQSMSGNFPPLSTSDVLF